MRARVARGNEGRPANPAAQGYSQLREDQDVPLARINPNIAPIQRDGVKKRHTRRFFEYLSNFFDGLLNQYDIGITAWKFPLYIAVLVGYAAGTAITSLINPAVAWSLVALGGATGVVGGTLSIFNLREARRLEKKLREEQERMHEAYVAMTTNFDRDHQLRALFNASVTDQDFEDTFKQTVNAILLASADGKVTSTKLQRIYKLASVLFPNVDVARSVKLLFAVDGEGRIIKQNGQLQLADGVMDDPGQLLVNHLQQANPLRVERNKGVFSNPVLNAISNVLNFVRIGINGSQLVTSFASLMILIGVMSNPVGWVFGGIAIAGALVLGGVVVAEYFFSRARRKRMAKMEADLADKRKRYLLLKSFYKTNDDQAEAALAAQHAAFIEEQLAMVSGVIPEIELNLNGPRHTRYAFENHKKEYRVSTAMQAITGFMIGSLLGGFTVNSSLMLASAITGAALSITGVMVLPVSIVCAGIFIFKMVKDEQQARIEEQKIVDTLHTKEDQLRQRATTDPLLRSALLVEDDRDLVLAYIENYLKLHANKGFRNIMSPQEREFLDLQREKVVNQLKRFVGEKGRFGQITPENYAHPDELFHALLQFLQKPQDAGHQNASLDAVSRLRTHFTGNKTRMSTQDIRTPVVNRKRAAKTVVKKAVTQGLSYLIPIILVTGIVVVASFIGLTGVGLPITLALVGAAVVTTLIVKKVIEHRRHKRMAGYEKSDARLDLADKVGRQEHKLLRRGQQGMLSKQAEITRDQRAMNGLANNQRSSMAQAAGRLAANEAVAERAVALAPAPLFIPRALSDEEQRQAAARKAAREAAPRRLGDGARDALIRSRSSLFGDVMSLGEAAEHDLEMLVVEEERDTAESLLASRSPRGERFFDAVIEDLPSGSSSSSDEEVNIPGELKSVDSVPADAAMRLRSGSMVDGN